jgi:hypothetical protein
VSCSGLYTDYIIDQRLLVPIVTLVKEINAEDSTLHSAALGVFQAVRYVTSATSSSCCTLK